MASSGSSAANFLTATTPSSVQVQVKSNKGSHFVIPGRKNGVVPKVPKLGNTFRQNPHLFAASNFPAGNLPVATTPASGAHGRGLGGTKGGGSRKMRKSRFSAKRRTHRRRTHRSRK